MSGVFDESYCNGAIVPEMTIGNQSGMTYHWRQIGGGYIGLDVVSGENTIPSFVAINNGSNALIATFEVTIFNNTCQGNTVTFNIIVDPQVVLTSATQISNLCSEATLDYMITSNRADAVISWSRPSTAGINNGAAISGTGPHILETLMNNTDTAITVTYIVELAYGTCITTAEINVIVLPVPQITINPNVDLCINSNEVRIPFTLPDAQQGMVMYYSITFNDDAIYAGFTNISHRLLTGDEIVFSAPLLLPEGTYAATLRIQAANGCWNIAPINFIINRIGLPEILEQPQSVTMCDTIGFVLSVVTRGGTSYQWFKDDVAIMGANGPSYMVEHSDSSSFGTYYVAVTGSCGMAFSDKATVRMNPLTLLTKWTDVIFVSNVDNHYVAYQWYKDGKAIGINGRYQSYLDEGGLNGTYSVRVTYIDGTTEMSCPYTVNLTQTKSHIMIYPNPTVPYGDVTVDLSSEFQYSTEARGTKVEFYDMAGRLIQTTFMQSPIERITLNASNGFYLLKITTPTNRIFVEKIVID
jgi:hypothetical protein